MGVKMMNAKILQLSAICLVGILVFPGNTYAEKKQLEEISVEDETKLKPDFKSLIFRRMTEGMVLDYDEKIVERMKTQLALPVNFIATKFQDIKSPLSPKKRIFEISLIGSYLLSTGTPKVMSVAPDLYTGRWSPWFGQGYEDFSWKGPNPPRSLDSVIGAAVVNQENGFCSGFRLGIDIHPRWCIEFLFDKCTGGLRFEDEAWDAIKSVIPDSVNTLKTDFYLVRSKDTNVQSAGYTDLYGLNINYNILEKGSFIPYVSAGVFFIDSHEDLELAFDLERVQGGGHEAGENWSKWGHVDGHFLWMGYSDDTSVSPSVGLGANILISQKVGIKLEAKTIYSRLKVEQKALTSYYKEGGVEWIEYDEYDNIAATHKVDRFILMLGIGFFIKF
jgi:hypothetical protein